MCKPRKANSGALCILEIFYLSSFIVVCFGVENGNDTTRPLQNMRYPGPDEDSESNSLWDISIQDEYGVDHEDNGYFDSTLSEHSDYSLQEDQIQHPARPTTPEPLPGTSARFLQFGSIAADSIAGGSGGGQRRDSRRQRTDNMLSRSDRSDFHSFHRHPSSSYENFVPMVSINVPSRQNQRLSRLRRNSARLGSNSSLQRQNIIEEMSAPLFRTRPISPSRIPMPMRNNTTFRHSIANMLVTRGSNDGDEEALDPSLPNNMNFNNEYLTQRPLYEPSSSDRLTSSYSPSYLTQSNPAVARFIQPPTTSTNTTLSDSSTQTDARILADMRTSERSLRNVEEVETQIILSDDELVFDNFIQLTDHPHRDNLSSLTCGIPSSPCAKTHQLNLTKSTCSSEKENSRCESENSSASTQSTSGLSMRSRQTIPPELEQPENCSFLESSDEEDSDTSTTQMEEDMVSMETSPDNLKQTADSKTSPNILKQTADEEVPGPSNIAAVSTELAAELVLDDSTVSKNGKCKLVFSDILVSDLSDLLGQNLTLALKDDKVIVLRIDQPHPKDTGKLKPIRRSISRYLGGKVLRSVSSKKVSFCPDLVRERKLSESVSSTSGGAFGWSGEKGEGDEDILSELEDFEED
ncbi:hypothetical protein ACHWQZ_G002058 [Mnemiopsis leidyi]